MDQDQSSRYHQETASWRRSLLTQRVVEIMWIIWTIITRLHRCHGHHVFPGHVFLETMMCFHYEIYDVPLRRENILMICKQIFMVRTNTATIWMIPEKEVTLKYLDFMPRFHVTSFNPDILACVCFRRHLFLCWCFPGFNLRAPFVCLTTDRLT